MSFPFETEKEVLLDDDMFGNEGSQIMDPGSGKELSDFSDDASSDFDTLVGQDIEEQENEKSISNSHWQPVTSRPRAFSFSGKEELTCLAIPSKDEEVWPMDVYKFFMNDDILDLIVEQTNTYAEQVLAWITLAPQSRLNSWHPVTKHEIKKFLGIIMYMGLVPLPEIDVYWSKSILYENKLVPQTMHRDRFSLILRLIDFADNTQSPTIEKKHKIKKFLHVIIKRYQAVYKPGSELVIGESQVSCSGNFSSEVCIPGKSHQCGCKLIKLCTVDGYTLNVEVCCRQEQSVPPPYKIESLVFRLLANYTGKGCTVFADSYFTSNILAEHLLTQKTYLCGTLCPNQKNIPKELVQDNLKKGEMKALESAAGVKVYNWMNDTKVLTISTVPEHGGHLVSFGKVSKNQEEVKQPPSMISYSKARKGVDIFEEMPPHCSPIRKSRKWYRNAALDVICNTSVVNAWVIYNKYYNSKKISFRAFKESIILSLTHGISKEELKKGKKCAPIAGSTSCIHQLQGVQGPKSKTRKRCRGCYERISQTDGRNEACRKSKRVTTFCAECEGQPFLCLSCFNSKHGKDL